MCNEPLAINKGGGSDPGQRSVPAARAEAHQSNVSNDTPDHRANIYFWLTLLLSLPVVGPLLQPGYFWGAHDARHSVYFLHQFNKVIQDGVWYPRWAPDFAFGYGYPFFNIYGPLSSYAGQTMLWLGLDIVTAVKVVFGVSAVLSGLSMYFFIRRILGPPAAMIAALTYVYIPYHLFDLYVRAALAESVGFVFVPLTMWGFYEVVTRPRLPALLWAALAYAGLMFTSNLLALMFTPILGLYVAYMITWQFLELSGRGGREPLDDGGAWPIQFPWLNRLSEIGHRRKRSHPARLALNVARAFIQRGIFSALTLGLGLGLSAIFWLPAVVEYPYVRVDQWVGGRFAFGDDFVEFFQLFSPQWGFGASIPGPDDEASFQIGLAATVLFLLSFWVVPKLVDPLIRRTLYFFQALTLVMLFLTIPLSGPVWTVLPLSSFAQFPWRLLVIIAPLISAVAGVVMVEAGDRWITPDAPAADKALVDDMPNLGPIPLPVILLSSLILLSSFPYLRADVRDPRPTEGPVSQAALFRFQQSSDEMTGQTAWVRRIPNWSTLAEQVEGGGQISTKVNYTALPADDSVGVFSMEMDSRREFLWVGTDRPGQTVTFFIPYYPGWQAYVYEDLGPHDGNLDKNVGPVERIGPMVDQPKIRTTPIEGWMVVPIPPGSHFLEIRFEDTIVRIVGRWISILSVLLWLGLFIGTFRPVGQLLVRWQRNDPA